MSNGYIESSLKRFLKRKVKVTLGLVVAFMITGTVGFAEDNREQEHKDKITGITTAITNLKGLGKEFEDFESKTIAILGKNYTISIQDNTLSFIEAGSSTTTSMTIDKKYVSTALKEKIDGMLKNITDCTNEDKITNDSILLSSQGGTIATGKITNDGIIFVSGYAQAGTNGAIIENNGIIYSTSTGNVQYITNSGTGKVINNGIIYAPNGNAQGMNTTSAGNEIINNGVIYSKNGQSAKGDAKVTNNGIIYATATGQGYIGTETGSNFINLGIIEANVGQKISGAGNRAYNYGLIETTGNAIKAEKDGQGYNYGVIKVSDAENAFSGNVENKGIVIADKGTLSAQYNTGILLYSNYDVVGNDTTIFKAGDTVQSFGEKDSFGENSKGFVKNESIDIDNTQNKVIGAVVTEKLDKAVFNYTNENSDLFLKGTQITGYFETDGTLLDVGNSNLTLGGDTNITAVKDNFDLNVVAVNIGKSGTITIMDNAKINGFIQGDRSSMIIFADTKGEYEVTNAGDVTITISDENVQSEYQKYFDVVLSGATENIKDNSVNKIEISTENAIKDLTNRLVIEDNLTVKANDKGNSIYDTNNSNENAEFELDIKNMKNIEGNIVLGVGKDTVAIDNVDNTDYSQQLIDLGDGNDKFIANGHAQEINIFNYNVKNAETLELNGGTWGNWNEAQGKISFDNADTDPDFVVGNSTTMIITLNAEGSYGSDFANYIKDTLGKHAVITGTDKDSVVKYLISEDGLDSSNLNTENYSFGEGVSYKDSPIFNIDSTAGEGVTISVKTGEEMGLSGQDRIIYEAYLEQIKAGNANKDVINQINGFDTQEDFVSIIKDTQTAGKAYYTAGSVVTKDITNTYLSAVEDFRKRAGKGEWLAQGKYINSDTEFDGGSSVRGYEGDITGTVGMIEYGVSENTSYGAVFGMGDSEMDINGGGNLEGDNIYAGLYMKHRTANGIELVGNLGYMENDMDSSIRSDFTGTNDVAINGTTFEKGTADSSAFVLSLKGRKDYRLSDTVRLQPTLGARATLINQEKAENTEMHFTISEQDIIVLEGTAGMGIAKDIALSNGKVELNAGVEYTFAVSNTNNDAEYTLFEGDYRATHIKMDDVDAAENTGTVYVGADYEHENGVGFNGKYEMMWSDKGDDSRITAGISYRF